MMRSRVARWLFCGAAATLLSPAVALAQEEGAAAASDPMAVLGKAMGAALAIGLTGLGAGYAQSRIGAAGAGTLAERPEAATWIMVLQALPEIIALLGFAIAYLIIAQIN